MVEPGPPDKTLPDADRLMASLAVIGLLALAGIGIWKSIDTANPIAGSVYLLIAGMVCVYILELARRYERELKPK
jgi:hypothetical protein